MSQFLYCQDTDVPDSISPIQWLNKNGYCLENTKHLNYRVDDTIHDIYWLKNSQTIHIENEYNYEISVALISEQEYLEMIAAVLALIHPLEPTELVFKECHEGPLLYNNEHDNGSELHQYLEDNKIDECKTMVTFYSAFNDERYEFILHHNACVVVYQGCDRSTATQETQQNAAQKLVNYLTVG